MSSPRFTFAVIGHNEAETLAFPIRQAIEAAEPGDRVWFVDSASTDGSAALAAGLGVEVIEAPLGKGLAIARALELCDDGYICFGDADVSWSSRNIPRGLRELASRLRPDMLVASVTQTERARLSVTPGVHNPLVGALFPSALERFPPGIFALTGFRALNASIPLRELPQGYGVETHLNLLFHTEGRRMLVEDLGVCTNPLRGYENVPAIAVDVAEAILDFAVARGRLDAEARAAWDAWVEEVLGVIRSQPPAGAPDDDYRDRLAAAAARPLPPAKKAVA